jgi:hypothetical protein
MTQMMCILITSILLDANPKISTQQEHLLASSVHAVDSLLELLLSLLNCTFVILSAIAFKFVQSV